MPDDSRFPLKGMQDGEPTPPKLHSRLPVPRRGANPILWILVAAGMLVATFYALSAVLGG